MAGFVFAGDDNGQGTLRPFVCLLPPCEFPDLLVVMMSMMIAPGAHRYSRELALGVSFHHALITITWSDCSEHIEVAKNQD